MNRQKNGEGRPAQDLLPRAARAAGYTGFYLLILNLFLCLYRGKWADLQALGVFGPALALLAFGFATRRRAVAAAITGRRLRIGANVTVAASLFAVAIVLANYFAARHRLSLDLTRSGEFTLQERTRRLLAELPERLPEGEPAVKAVAILGRPAGKLLYWRNRLVRTLELYRDSSSAFRLEVIDRDQNADRARAVAEQLGLAEENEEGVHLVLGEDRRSISWPNDLLRPTGQPGRFLFAAEEALTVNIEALLAEGRITIGLLTGHGERSARPPGAASSRRGTRLLALAGRLSLEENRRLIPVGLAGGARPVPSECDILVVAGPRTTVPKEEVAAIRAWLEEAPAGPGGERRRTGRGLLLFLDPSAEGRSGFEELLGSCGMELRADRIVLSSELAAVGGSVTRESLAGAAAPPGTHPILASVRPPDFRFFGACVLGLAAGEGAERKGTRVKGLVAAPPGSWSIPVADLRRSEGGEILNRPKERSAGQGDLWLAVAAELDLPAPGSSARVPDTARIVVVADADFPTDHFEHIAPGNIAFALSAIMWLGREEPHPVFRARVERAPVVVFRPGEARQVLWATTIGPALIALVMAAVAAFLRRR